MISTKIKKEFVELIQDYPRKSSRDIILPLIGDCIMYEDDYDYYKVVFKMISKLEINQVRFVVNYIRTFIKKGYDPCYFFDLIWYAYLGRKKELINIFENHVNYNIMFRMYISTVLNMIKKN